MGLSVFHMRCILSVAIILSHRQQIDFSAPYIEVSYQWTCFDHKAKCICLFYDTFLLHNMQYKVTGTLNSAQHTFLFLSGDREISDLWNF